LKWCTVTALRRKAICALAVRSCTADVAGAGYRHQLAVSTTMFLAGRVSVRNRQWVTGLDHETDASGSVWLLSASFVVITATG
jgi:hypothetical protein